MNAQMGLYNSELFERLVREGVDVFEDLVDRFTELLLSGGIPPGMVEVQGELAELRRLAALRDTNDPLYTENPEAQARLRELMMMMEQQSGSAQPPPVAAPTIVPPNVPTWFTGTGNYAR